MTISVSSNKQVLEEMLFYKYNRGTPQCLEENHGKILHKVQEIICMI